MGEYAAFLLILVFGFACGYGTARARGEKQPKAELPDIGKIRIEEGDTIIVRYKGFLTREQREALVSRFGEKARKVVVLEAGLEVEVLKSDDDAYQKAFQSHMNALNAAALRRRDDNRAQRPPEGPWN